MAHSQLRSKLLHAWQVSQVQLVVVAPLRPAYHQLVLRVGFGELRFQQQAHRVGGVEGSVGEAYVAEEPSQRAVPCHQRRSGF